MAKGEVVAHFDDDDFYHPDYLDHMLSRMQGLQADVLKLSQWMWYDLASRKLALFDGLSDGDHSRLYGYGFSYLYKRAAILDVQFEAMNFGEDYEMVCRAMADGRAVRHCKAPPGLNLVLHVLHGHNTSSCFATKQFLPDLHRLFGTACAGHVRSVMQAICSSRASP
eukprot:CAMPEP_0196574730 /NCGR_PEP_ID=MMETSP1081-20130531/4380_1 /TAXON_ID=36882 /ORGANISM="Pyramimonas amylifera, Strain CCMP720" /LENGTH=166 /DNA_ID=CAMNT_0041892837 /DNA_START=341 /DNA_END=841 /DNA_ORIENTATION=+